jgi:hypothetical protein
MYLQNFLVLHLVHSKEVKQEIVKRIYISHIRHRSEKEEKEEEEKKQNNTYPTARR